MSFEISNPDASLDLTDLQLLDLLQRDAGQSNLQLAAQLHISPPTCLRRVRRLHALGLIERQVAIVRPEALAQLLGLTDRVTFHGPLYDETLNTLVARCDVGVGSLGMYRYGLAQGMTLKLREYLARGLPFVSAVDDPALPADADFALRVPNDDTPIDMNAIVAFAQKAKSDAELSARMRAYAQASLSWEGVLRGVLERVSP